MSRCHRQRTPASATAGRRLGGRRRPLPERPAVHLVSRSHRRHWVCRHPLPQLSEVDVAHAGQRGLAVNDARNDGVAWLCGLCGGRGAGIVRNRQHGRCQRRPGRGRHRLSTRRAQRQHHRGRGQSRRELQQPRRQPPQWVDERAGNHEYNLPVTRPVRIVGDQRHAAPAFYPVGGRSALWSVGQWASGSSQANSRTSSASSRACTRRRTMSSIIRASRSPTTAARL
jgi:hypothetical protein